MLVIGTALALTVGLGMTLSRFSDGSGGGADQAVQTAGNQAPSTTTPTSGAVEKDKVKKKRKKKQKVKLPEPSGPCLASDIVATPIIKDAVAGRPVTLRFRIVTRMSLACTWQASSSTLTMKITSGKDLIWTSQQCSKAVPTKDLVLRRSKASWLSMTWSARRSDDECPRATDWALPGWYHISVAPLGGEPENVQFKLSQPQPEVVTASPSPSQAGKGSGKNKDKSPGRSKNSGKNQNGAASP
jgi:hypothetical protein